MTTLAQQYTAHWRPIVTPIAAKYGINPDFVLTQIAQESLWGTKTPKGSNNFAGIRDFRKKSDGVMASDAGNVRKFRKFDNEQAFAEHYINMLYRLYPGTVGAKSIQEFTSALQDGKRKYAEAGHYKKALEDVYNQHYANNVANQQTTTEPAQGIQQPTYNQYQAGVGAVDYMTSMGQLANGAGLPTPKDTVDKDPYADMWNVKAQSFQSGNSSRPSIVSGKSPYSQSTQVQWGIK